MASTVLLAAGLGLSTTAGAALRLLQPDPAVPATFIGNGGYSADGLGQVGSGLPLMAQVPAGSTVVQAYLYGTYNPVLGRPSEAQRTIIIDNTPVVMAEIAYEPVTPFPGTFFTTARADVTALVSAKVGSGGGTTNFVVNNDPTPLDGVGLVVIYSNPAMPLQTIAVLDGSAGVAGSTATFRLGQPLDKTTPQFEASMSLGIGFSAHSIASNVCGGSAEQISIVDINGRRLTRCAGGANDGRATNGVLITVGGVGDSRANPDPLLPGPDDELYDLEPFLEPGVAEVAMTTFNPSGDDNLFLAVIALAAEAQVRTEVCDNSLDDDGDGAIDSADQDCLVIPPPVEICDNGLDDDGDQLIDRADSDCPIVPEICDNEIDDDGDGAIDQADTDCPLGNQRMTGGGSVTVGGTRVTHGFGLRCGGETPGTMNNLQVNWGKGQRFHLESVETVACIDDPAISEGKPFAGFDTLTGRGTGRYNGATGATAEWTMSDAGEPGGDDRFTVLIRDASGRTVLDASGEIKAGNHQAHP